MKPLCCTTVVNEGYQEYIPLYVYFLRTAYPEYDVLVYFDGTLYPEVAACLELLADIGGFEIKPLLYAYDRTNSHALMSLRWLLYDDLFEGYENVYIGDVDMFIVREDTPLHEAHVAHAQRIGLPYSNRVRKGACRLTGLHFVRTADYYPKVLPVIDKYRRLIAQRAIDMNNEELLYRMMEESVGLPQTSGRFTTHHGVHMRVFDSSHDLAYQRARTDYVFAEHFEPYVDRFMEAARAPLCGALLQHLSQITYSTGTLSRYARGGPGLSRQMSVVRTLCRAVQDERGTCAAPANPAATVSDT